MVKILLLFTLNVFFPKPLIIIINIYIYNIYIYIFGIQLFADLLICFCGTVAAAEAVIAGAFT